MLAILLSAGSLGVAGLGSGRIVESIAGNALAEATAVELALPRQHRQRLGGGGAVEINQGFPVHLLLPASPAVDRGSSTLAVDRTNSGQVLTTDQRGVSLIKRTVGSSVDMGSTELFSLTTPLVVTVAADENDGNVSPDRKSTRLNSSHVALSRMTSSA